MNPVVKVRGKRQEKREKTVSVSNISQIRNNTNDGSRHPASQDTFAGHLRSNHTTLFERGALALPPTALLDENITKGVAGRRARPAPSRTP
jgi:hypothetical protein